MDPLRLIRDCTIKGLIQRCALPCHHLTSRGCYRKSLDGCEILHAAAKRCPSKSNNPAPPLPPTTPPHHHPFLSRAFIPHPTTNNRSTSDETHIHLDEQNALPRKSQTNYKSRIGKGFLTVEAIWFLMKSYDANPTMIHGAYMKEALAAKIAGISLLDRKDLIDFLTGKIDTSTNIDLTAGPCTCCYVSA